MSFHDPLTEAQRQLRVREGLIVALIVLLAFALFAWDKARQNLEIDVYPGLSQKMTARPGMNYAENAFTFATTLLDNIYRWRTDGKTEYRENLLRMRPYLTDSCMATLSRDEEARRNAGELGSRTRRWDPLPESFFSPERVRVIDSRTWLVTLDAELTETIRGETVKNAAFRYEAYIQTTTADRGTNPFGLLLNCFTPNSPIKLEPTK
jgi:integrating conjugative element protein (TIGR03746 family)